MRWGGTCKRNRLFLIMCYQAVALLSQRALREEGGVGMGGFLRREIWSPLGTREDYMCVCVCVCAFKGSLSFTLSSPVVCNRYRKPKVSISTNHFSRNQTHKTTSNSHKHTHTHTHTKTQTRQCMQTINQH